jgi:hypothetical protein
MIGEVIGALGFQGMNSEVSRECVCVLVCVGVAGWLLACFFCVAFFRACFCSGCADEEDREGEEYVKG